MFHYFTLEEIYQFAEAQGYGRNQVLIDDAFPDDYIIVSFGQEYAEEWVWFFESLDRPSVDYEHNVWED